jgi:hypothetical protein
MMRHRRHFVAASPEHPSVGFKGLVVSRSSRTKSILLHLPTCNHPSAITQVLTTIIPASLDILYQDLIIAIMSCCPTNDCNNGDSTLTITLNVLDVVGNFAGVAVAIAFGLLQLRYWRRRHGIPDHPEAADIPLETRALRPQPVM